MGTRPRIAALVTGLLAAVLLVPATSADGALPRNGKIAFVRANQITWPTPTAQGSSG